MPTNPLERAATRAGGGLPLPASKGHMKAAAREPWPGGCSPVSVVGAGLRAQAVTQPGAVGGGGVSGSRTSGSQAAGRTPGAPSPPRSYPNNRDTTPCPFIHEGGRGLWKHTMPVHPPPGPQLLPPCDSVNPTEPHLCPLTLYTRVCCPSTEMRGGAPPHGTSRPLHAPCTNALFQALWLAWPAGDPSAPTVPPSPGPPCTPRGP